MSLPDGISSAASQRPGASGLAIETIRRALSWPTIKALIDAMTADEISLRFDMHDDYAVRARFIHRLAELCDDDEASAIWVRGILERTADHVDALKRWRRQSGDRAVCQLVMLLPSDEQLAYAGRFILHDRLSRRTAGYKILARSGAQALSAELGDAFRRYGDWEALVGLIATGANVTSLTDDIEMTIRRVNEPFHQALVLEQLLANDFSLATQLSATFPAAFAWAAGRRRDRAAKPYVVARLRERLDASEVMHENSRELFDSTRDMGILVWALGRTGGNDYLETLAEKYAIVMPWRDVDRDRKAEESI